ncbi:MAG: glycerophosphodiester phosphodiesterase [Propionibacteriaceae bacterium]
MSSPGRHLTPVISPAIFAHRGFSAAHPEMTLAAYHAAIDWARSSGITLGLECDVHFSADDQLICLHDLDVDRTSDAAGPAFLRTVAQLKRIDFGARRNRATTADERELVTLVELLDLIADARADGVDVRAVIETKHPNPRGLEVESRVADLLRDRGWDGPDSPCRVITFSSPGLAKLVELLPDVERTFLIDHTFLEWTDGTLPDGASVVGPNLELIRTDPAYVNSAQARGNQVHAWTINSPADVAFCLELGITGLTTDVPDLVSSVLRQGQDGPSATATGQDA